MKNINLTNVPEAYKHAVRKEQQGTIEEATYLVHNYINQARQLVSNQELELAQTGRVTIKADAILKKCNVYLPAGYNQKNCSTKYPVLYLLHGVGGNRFEWLGGSGELDGYYVICNIFDHLIANGEIEPCIIVFPDGRSAWDWKDQSFNPDGTNLLGFYYFDYELRYDLIPYIEEKYHTQADINNSFAESVGYNRMYRAIAGLSMGGMQSLNLVLGGYRYDSEKYTDEISECKNGLAKTVPAPGLLNLFAYVGAFSNAPTSSEGKRLGAKISSCDFQLDVLYMTCGDEDDIAYEMGYQNAIDGLWKSAGDKLRYFYTVTVKEGKHDFPVWLNGAYNFSRMIFSNTVRDKERYCVDSILCK